MKEEEGEGRMRQNKTESREELFSFRSVVLYER